MVSAFEGNGGESYSNIVLRLRKAHESPSSSLLAAAAILKLCTHLYVIIEVSFTRYVQMMQHMVISFEKLTGDGKNVRIFMTDEARSILKAFDTDGHDVTSRRPRL